MKQSQIVLVVALVLLAAALVAVALVLLDPVRQYVSADGTITIRGPVDQTLLDYVLHGPHATRIEIYELVGDGRPTAHFVPHVVYDYLPPIPRSSGSISGRLGSIQGFLSDAVRIIGGAVLDTIRTGIVSVFGFVTGNASAACTGGNCFWIAGTGNFSSTAHWATASGGASCTCIPGATDTVTFDASSGAGTATQDNATFTSGAVTMTNSSVTIAGSSNTWNVGGGWADANGHFSRGTSTVVITANGNVSGVGSTSTSEFYNLTINASVNAVAATDLGIGNVLTAGNSSVLNSGCPSGFFLNGSSSAPFVRGTSVTIFTHMDFNSSTTYQIPAGTYSGGQGSPAITILNAGGALAGSITTAACGGGGNTGDITISAPLDTTVSNYNITLAASVGDLTLNSATAAVGVHGSTVMVPGNVTISNVNAYINLGSSTWTIGGTWSNSSTVAQWNSGTSSITFTSPSGWTYTQNLSVTQPEFYSVTFASSNAGAAQTFPAGTNTTFGGTLTITGQNATATTTFDLSASNLSLTSTSIVINANGILNGRGSTVTVNGTFDPHAGTYTSGTSTVVLGATGNLDYSGAQAGVRKLWNLTINAGVTTTYQGNIGLHNRFTISGRLVASVDPASNFFMVAGEMVTDGLPVVFNSGADLSQSGFFDYRYEGGVSWTVVGTTYQMIGIEGGAVGFPETANFGGDISTPICGVYNLCEMIMNPEGPTLAGTDPPILTVNTNGHNVTLGGTLFLGDGPGFGVKFNAGSSTISAFGVSVNGNTIANFQSATINAHPSSTYNPVALYLVDTATLNGGSSTINNHGQLRLWVTSSVGLFSQSSTINVFADEGGCNVQLSGCPGDVAILAAGDFIDFGSSTWNVYGVSDNDWNSSSMSPLWSATPAATVNFLGIGNVQIGNNGNNFPLLNLRSSGSVQFLQSFGSYDTTIAPSVSTVLFTTGITWNFYGTRLTGPPGQKVTLKPTTGGAWYFISKSGTVNANNLDVQWSDASAGPQVQAQSNVRDSGSNLNWFFASPSPTPGCTGNQCGPLMSCNTTYVPLGFSISCSTLVPSTASTPIWYVNGSRVGIGPRLNTFVASFGFAQTVQVTLFFVTIDPTSQTASSTQYLTLNSSANVLVYIGLLLLGIVFVTSRDPRKKGAWIGFDVHNLAHRHLAISVGENPRGWRSYRQRPRGVFRPGSLRGRVFYSSTYGTDLWVIRGRLKTNGNWATQTVRERIKR